MHNEFHQFLKKFPLMASKNPQLNLLNKEELLKEGEASYRALIDSGIGEAKAFPMAIGLMYKQ